MSTPATARRKPATAKLKPAALMIVVVVMAAVLNPATARADVVDDAYAAGSEAAAAADWDGAIASWREALELLPGRSAQLDYDLGSAYAQRGELGLASYHLERALQAEARPSVEVAKLARRNLGVVRRQAEIAAETSDARISRTESWWELAIALLAGRALAWVSMLSGWALLLSVLVRAWRGRGLGSSRDSSDDSSDGRIGLALTWIFALVLLVGGGLHGLALTATTGSPEAIVIEPALELREGPGAHLPVALRVQGGSRVRVLESRSGWVRVRLPEGLEGWAREDSVREL